MENAVKTKGSVGQKSTGRLLLDWAAVIALVVSFGIFAIFAPSFLNSVNYVFYAVLVLIIFFRSETCCESLSLLIILNESLNECNSKEHEERKRFKNDTKRALGDE